MRIQKMRMEMEEQMEHKRAFFFPLSCSLDFTVSSSFFFFFLSFLSLFSLSSFTLSQNVFSFIFISSSISHGWISFFFSLVSLSREKKQENVKRERERVSE